jgi:hypothetical protein
MTAHRDLKDRIRDRQAKTGESYMAARSHVMRERAALLGLSADPAPAPSGRVEAAVLKVNALLRDLRCIDAHAHLGNLAFDPTPEEAILHYEVGVRIGELSLPAGFEGVLPWGALYNRPLLRCLHGYGSCLWRFGRLREAQAAFERNLSLNPNDNQGVPFCREDVRNGRNWEEMASKEAAP